MPQLYQVTQGSTATSLAQEDGGMDILIKRTHDKSGLRGIINIAPRAAQGPGRFDSLLGYFGGPDNGRIPSDVICGTSRVC